MFEGKRVAVVVPAHNEETQIETVIRTMPELVDQIVIVDDMSSDQTVKVVKELTKRYPKVHLIEHEANQGVGGAIVTGYKYARDQKYDVTVVMAGDAQMDPEDLPVVAGPVARGEVDYCKGNRLFTGEAFQKIPKVRYFGNSILSLMTKVASGYWHVADSQTGYTAINLRMLQLINWDQTYKRYGCPNDYLVRLNIYDATVRDVPINPVYDVGEKSGIRLHNVIPRMSLLIAKLFLWRMFQKYIIRDFHPLVLFYAMSALLLIPGVLLGLTALAYRLFQGPIATTSVLFVVFLLVSGIQFGLFAMFFDMETSRRMHR
jgi:glycosyltransferase involved in cell wall biosynthesis